MPDTKHHKYLRTSPPIGEIMWNAAAKNTMHRPLLLLSLLNNNAVSTKNKKLDKI